LYPRHADACNQNTGTGFDTGGIQHCTGASLDRAADDTGDIEWNILGDFYCTGYLCDGVLSEAANAEPSQDGVALA